MDSYTHENLQIDQRRVTKTRQTLITLEQLLVSIGSLLAVT